MRYAIRVFLFTVCMPCTHVKPTSFLFTSFKIKPNNTVSFHDDYKYIELEEKYTFFLFGNTEKKCSLVFALPRIDTLIA